MERNLLVRQKDFVVLHPAAVAFARHIFRQKHRVDAVHGARGGRIPAQNPRMGVGGTNRPDFERARRLVVGVNRFARDMLMPALVRRRPQTPRRRSRRKEDLTSRQRSEPRLLVSYTEAELLK